MTDATTTNYTKKQQEILEATVAHVKDKLSDEGSGHDWWHIYRVWQLAMYIGKKEKVNLFIVELGALLHDIADWKFTGGDTTAGRREADAFLSAQGAERADIEHVCRIIDTISYKGAGVTTKMESKEGLVVQDADRLDAVGAIGIARTFAYGGHANRLMYDPNIKPIMHATFEEYKKSKGTSFNHFYEKILLLKDRMNTDTAKALAEERHKFVEEFMARFLSEWNGEDQG